MYATPNSQPQFNTLVWGSLKPATTNLERHLGGEEVSKCPLRTQCSARQNTRESKAEGYFHFYKLPPYANSEEKNKHKPS